MGGRSCAKLAPKRNLKVDDDNGIREVFDVITMMVMTFLNGI